MEELLYLECYSGISGDMSVAALLDLGADKEVLLKALKSLPLDEFEVEISRVTKSGIDACDFLVICDNDGHDHDMAYLHGHEHHDEEHHHHHHHHDDEHHHHDDEHGHHHHHDDAHEQHHHHGHTHSHRGMKEVMEIIQGGDLTPGARALAIRIFEILAQAEAEAHGVDISEVHFHEVGAVDSIVDIVSVAVCLDNLGISRVVVPCVYEGQGTVRCQHGILPVPVPAVTKICAAHQIPLTISPVRGELVTPTGAAIVAAIRTQSKLPEVFTIEKTGVGAGKRDYECPGILRIHRIRVGAESGKTIEEMPHPFEDPTIMKLETNIDDCTGEALGFLMETLMEAGALDVSYSPVFMKKNRPGYLVTVICGKEKVSELEALVFAHTTTVGIRRCEMMRTVLGRTLKSVETSYGSVQVKECQVGSTLRRYPEYASVAAIVRQRGLSFQDVFTDVYGQVNGGGE